MPATRAAEGLTPTDCTNRPSGVRFSSRASTAITPTQTNSENGRPSRCPPPMKK